MFIHDKEKYRKLLFAILFILAITMIIIGFIITFSTKDKKNTKVQVSEFYLETEKLELEIGDNYQLIVHSNNKDDLLYSSSNPEVVAVDEKTGYLTVKGVGEADIVVMSISQPNLFRVCKVSVLNNDIKETEEDEIKVTGISFQKRETVLNIGSFEVLEYTISPNNATNKDVTWSSSNPDIVAVDETGKVTALKEGKSIITVTTVDGNKKESISVSVVNPKVAVKSISFFKKSTDLYVNSSEKINYLLEPKNATNQSITWSSSDSSIVSVDANGIIIGRKPGNAVVTATTNDGSKKASMIVNVLDSVVHVSNITLNKASISLEIGFSERIIATITPSYATNKDVTWSSSNSNVASVDADGVILGKKPGNAIVTATTNDGSKKASIEVTVLEPIVHVSNIALNKSNLSLDVGESEKIVATITPNNATNKKITWSSSNSNVASVDVDGVILGKKKGNAIVTATTNDGSKIASLEVTVLEPIIHVSKITLNKSSLSLKVGASEKIVATITPSNATNREITWSSTNSSIASVDANGTIKGIAVGTATITAKTSDGGKTDKITVTVIPIAVTGIQLNKTSLSLSVGSSEKIIATITPGNATNKDVTWSSSNSSIASVDTNGTIKGIATGTATITAKTNDGGKTAKVTVTVTPVSVESVTLSKTSETVYLNSTNLTTTLIATINPSNATNKTVTWSSSNSDVATVDNSGVVTFKNLGFASITATVEGKSASYNVTVKKKAIIIVGASQVVRMKKNVSSYDSSYNHYDVDDNTLKIIALSGTGFGYQVGAGWTQIENFIKNYANEKSYYEFYIYFPIAGNDVLKFSCDNITPSNSTIIQYMEKINQKIQSVKNNSYQVKAYVVSVQPVNPAQANGGLVVVNTNKNACVANYRSNIKYHTFNQTTKAILNSYSDLEYVETFMKIMDVSGSYSFKVSYNTTDGVHWDADTTRMYVRFMLEDNGNL